MNTALSKRRVALITLFASASALGIILRLISLLFFYDWESGYYISGAILPIITNCIIWCSATALLPLCFIFLRKSGKELPCGASPFRVVGGVLGVCTSLLLAGSDIIRYIDWLRFSDTSSPEQVTFIQKFTENGRASLLMFLLSLMCALYFICSVVRINATVKVICGIFASLRVLGMLCAQYFDYDIGLNSSDKLMFCIACAAVMVALSSELKRFAGNAVVAVFSAVSGFTAIVGLSASLPSIIAVHAGKGAMLGGIYFEYYLLFAFAVFSATSFIESVLQKDKEVSIP